jgi:MFS family permease
MLMVAGMFGMFFLGTLYMQQVLHYDALRIGLAFLPTALTIGGLSGGLSARVITRFGPRPVLVTGLLLIVGGLVLFTRTPVDGMYLTDLMPAILLIGVGAGLSFPAMMALAMSGATPSDAGIASGLVNTAVQVGGALGLAVLATLATSRTNGLIVSGQTLEPALTSGFHLAFGIGAVLLATAVGLALTVLRAGPVQAELPAGQRVPDAAPAVFDCSLAHA